MTVIEGEQRARARRELDEIEQIKRLIEIQKEIVELAKQNELVERECAALRQELSPSWRRRTRMSPLHFLRAITRRFARRA